MPAPSVTCWVHREVVGACSGAEFDENVAMVAKMNEMFAFGGAEHISLPCCGLGCDDAQRQCSADAEDRYAKE